MIAPVRSELVQLTTTRWGDDASRLPRRVAHHRVALSDGVGVSVPAGAELVEWIDGSGVRRFQPLVLGDHECVAEFILYLSAMGEAILEHRGEPIEKAGFSVSALRLFIQQGKRLRERFRRRFKRNQDLIVPRSVRPFVGMDSVLPECLGRELDPDVNAWSIADLLERGRREGESRGFISPDFEDLVQAGLYGRACEIPIDPNDLTDQEIECLVRIGLFDLGEADRPDEATMREVTERLAESIGSHLEDDTDSFHRWFFDNVHNIVKQVAQKKGNSGPIDPRIVRRVQLEVVFEAYQHTARCFSIAMLEVLATLQSDLTEADEEHFRKVFVGSPEFGSFPLLVVRDRLDELALDPLTVDVELLRYDAILRLFSYYAEMNHTRREVDRELKRRQLARNNSGNVSQHFELNDSTDTSSEDHSLDVVQELAARAREQHQVSCDCGHDDGWDDSVADADAGFVFVHRCRACDAVYETQVDGAVADQLS